MRNFLKQFPKQYLEHKDGYQWRLQFGNQYQLSIINHKTSMGYPDHYEIGIFGDCDTMTELPGITEEGNNVKGYLTSSEIDVIIMKMIAITGNLPINVNKC